MAYVLVNVFVSLEVELQCSLRDNARFSSNFTIVFKTKGKLADEEESAIFHGLQGSKLEVTVYCELPPNPSFHVLDLFTDQGYLKSSMRFWKAASDTLLTLKRSMCSAYAFS